MQLDSGEQQIISPGFPSRTCLADVRDRDLHPTVMV